MLNMDMKKIQELPTPEDLKKEFPLPYKVQKIKKQRDQEIEDIFTGKDDRLILIIGPCSADREDAVLDVSTQINHVQRVLDIRGCCINQILIPKRIC